jgi:ParB family chromosome partitioning protein
MNTVYQSVALESIKESASNPRQHFDEKGMAELTESIRTKGVVAPLLLRPMEGFYELVDGARRYRAAKAAGLETVPAILRHMSDEDALEVQVISNLQRQDVHPLDEAEGYKRLLDTTRYDVAALAAKVGKSKTYIYSRLQLTQLIPAAKKMLLADDITVGHAVLICRLTAAVQKMVVEEFLHDWSDQISSVSELRQRIENEVMLDLSAASFPKNDPLLAHSAGACTACTKRTGFDKELFSDITKKDLCTDAKCFHAKVEAFITRAVKDGVVQISEYYSSTKKGVLGHYSWSEPAKGCKSKVKGIYVDTGGSHRGKMRDICMDKKCPVCKAKASSKSSSSSSPAQSTEDRYERRMEIWNGRVEQAFRQRLYDELLPTIGGMLTRSHLIMILRAVNDHYSSDTLHDISEKLGLDVSDGYWDGMEEWEDALHGLTDDNITQLIFGMIVRKELIVDPSNDNHIEAEQIQLLHKIHAQGKVDAAAIRAAVTSELEDKKPKPPKIEKPAEKKAKREAKSHE